jgi:uncharacterized protein (TIGR02996 family)
MHDDAFLEALRDERSEGVRLIYADWLEEKGDLPRAEFVRVQCALARLPAGAPDRWHLEARERALLRRHERAWLGPLHGSLKRWGFRLGLLEHVTLTAERFLRHAEALPSLGPLGEVELHGAAAYAGTLAACPHLVRLRGLNLSYNFLNDAAAELLAASPNLGRLRVLRLAHNFLRNRGAEALAASAHLGGLTTLDLRGNKLGQPATRALRDRFGRGLLL